jgi:hypothetical protein
MPETYPPPDEIVRLYLRAQNLEQIHRVDEAIEIYETAVAAGFDAAGPYDRLIAIYHGRDLPDDAKRVAEAALANVRMVAEKRDFYESVRDAAASARDRRGAEF